ncbi:MAG: serine hydrolase [Acidimicrobiia bacterium]|nr:serine hydrolase [Acidimicrobiia bacterium]
MRRGFWVLLVCFALVAACSGGSGETTTAPPETAAATTVAPSTTAAPPETAWAPWPTDEWAVSTPEEQGMDSAVLVDLVEAMIGSDGYDSVTVVRNGYVVLDTVLHPFPDDTKHHCYSVTKSVIGTLIGIAIDRGLLAGVDVPVVEILSGDVPATVDGLKASMTVEDLLTMSTGLDCRDSAFYEWEGLDAWLASDDWTAHVLALPMAEEPGTRFEYCNGASFLLSAILSEVTGQSAAEFADDVLFGPLGITDYSWLANDEGITHGWTDLWLHRADMARIGYLFLRSGDWDGEQIVSREWVEASTTPQANLATSTDDYGYQWWIFDALDYAYALGFGGQYILLAPEHDLVVVFTAQRDDWTLSFTTEHIVGAIASADPLPANPDAQSRLTDVVAVARSGPEAAAVELPEIARVIDGARYEFEDNEYGFRAFTILFEGDGAVYREEYADAVVEGAVGLDGRFATASPAQFEIDGIERTSVFRGTWRDDRTFVIEFRSIGEALWGKYRFTFDGDTARMWDEILTTGDDIWLDAVRVE